MLHSRIVCVHLDLLAVPVGRHASPGSMQVVLATDVKTLCTNWSGIGENGRLVLARVFPDELTGLSRVCWSDEHGAETAMVSGGAVGETGEGLDGQLQHIDLKSAVFWNRLGLGQVQGLQAGLVAGDEEAAAYRCREIRLIEQRFATRCTGRRWRHKARLSQLPDTVELLCPTPRALRIPAVWKPADRVARPIGNGRSDRLADRMTEPTGNQTGHASQVELLVSKYHPAISGTCSSGKLAFRTPVLQDQTANRYFNSTIGLRCWKGPVWRAMPVWPWDKCRRRGLLGNLPGEVGQRSMRVTPVVDADMDTGSKTPQPAVFTRWATWRNWSTRRRVDLKLQLGFAPGVQRHLHQHDYRVDLDTWGSAVRHGVQLDVCREV